VLIPAALGCGLLWVGAVAIAGLELGTPTLIALGAAGVLTTAVVLLLLQHQYSRLRSLAGTDALTGLANHRNFHETLAARLDLAREQGSPLALVILDLDNFKPVNDAHGHPYGDEVLRSVGAALRGAVPAGGQAARIGGEEFGLILPGANGRAAFEIAELARAAVAAIPVYGFELSCSAGVAAFPGDAEDPSTLHQVAASALAWAKRGGKRRTRRYDPGHAPSTWTERQRAEVEELLVHERPITSVFQPVVSLASGRIVGFEALARFPDPNGRRPDVWFAQAHGSGLGAQLEAVAIRAALEPGGRSPDVHLAINVSPSALGSDLVQHALGGVLDGVVVEITEHEFVPDDGSLAAAVAALRERGAMIAIDDAGAGHAGLQQLMAVRPDIVKLDRALIQGIHKDVARMALVESFVRFARDVGATVCAEGIETLDELAVVADLDVEWGQGFALARPAPPWTEVSPIAAEVCRMALAESFHFLPTEHQPVGASDRRLVHLSARLAAASSPRDLEGALGLIAAELGSTKVCLSAYHAEAGLIETLVESGEATDETVFELSDYPLSAAVLRDQIPIQTVAGDPESDPHEVTLLLNLGERSVLMVPVVSRGQSIGIIEAYRRDERAWTRAEVNRARVIANQFASVIPTLSGTEKRPARAERAP
jgi:diguanylate cyclase (GGDEF)-like protein